MPVLQKIPRSGVMRLVPACLLAAALSLAPLPAADAQTPAAANSAANIDAVKKALLDDPLFISHLRDKMSIEAVSGDTIRQYLLAHPGVLLEMQEMLDSKAAAQAQNAGDQAKILQENQQLLYHSAGDYTLGNKNAKIAVLEFFDYNCGYCKRAFEAEKKFAAAHSNVKIIMKDYPILSDDSVKAHLVAQAVKQTGSQKYPAFHERLMQMQGRATEESALAAAASLGFDKAALQKLMHDPKTTNSMVQGAQVAYRLGLNYTPVFILGNKVLGAVDMQALGRIVAEREKGADKGG